jgi:hypothetical protein
MVLYLKRNTPLRIGQDETLWVGPDKLSQLNRSMQLHLIS